MRLNRCRNYVSAHNGSGALHKVTKIGAGRLRASLRASEGAREEDKRQHQKKRRLEVKFRERGLLTSSTEKTQRWPL
jgi:hypothetical protein